MSVDKIIVNSTDFKIRFKKKFNINATCIYNPLNKKEIIDEIQRGNKVKTRPDLLKQIEDLAKQNAVGNANTVFRTARGSKYYVQDDGTTVRDKKKKSAKDPDQTSGIQDKSIKTIYLNEKELD